MASEISRREPRNPVAAAEQDTAAAGTGHIPPWLRRACTLQVAILAMAVGEVAELAARLHRGWVRADHAHQEARHNTGVACPATGGQGECPMAAMACEVFTLWSDVHSDLSAMRLWPEITALLNTLPAGPPEQ